MQKNYTFAQDLAALLVAKKLWTHDQAQSLQKVFEESDIDHFADFLVEEGMVEREVLLDALSDYYKVPAVDVGDLFFERSLLIKFPEDFLVRHGVIPLEREENMLMVVASDPSDDEMVSELRGFVSYDIKCLVGLRQDIIDAIREYYDPALTEDAENSSLDEENMLEKAAHDVIESDDEF
jgi:hypothetical protein